MGSESMGQEAQVEPPTAAPMCVNHDAVVMGFLRLPSRRVAAMYKVDLHL